MFGIREQLAWRKVRQTLSQEKPLLLAITGTANTALAKEAIHLVLQNKYHLRTSPPHLQSPRQAVVRTFQQARGPLPDAIALELCAQKPGQIDEVARQLPFNVVVGMSIGSKALDLFGSKEMVAHEHTSLASVLPKDGHLILNCDEPLVENMASHSQATATFFGTSARAHVRLIRSLRTSQGGFTAEVAVGNHSYQLALPHLFSFTQLYAPLAALAVAYRLHVDITLAAKVLGELHAPHGELSLTPTPSGAKIIDATKMDTPETIMAAMHALRTFPAPRKIVILGDLTDLASETLGLHKRLGRSAAESSHIFVAVGNHMRQAGMEALRRRPGPDVHHFTAAKEVGQWLLPYLTPHDVILIAGSPDMHMEKVVVALART